MKRFKFIISVLGLAGTIAELFLIGFYGCIMYAIGNMTVAYIENAETTRVSLGEFAFTIGVFFVGGILLLLVARFVWEYRLNKKDEEIDYE